MALNYIFIGFFVIAFVVALLRTLAYYFREHLIPLGFNIGEADLHVFQDIVNSTFAMAETSIGIVIYLIGIMTLWLGIMRVGERAGAIDILAKKLEPFLQPLFPELPKGHPAFGNMVMNFSANMLGLDNAATPLGLKAMNSLQEINPQPEKASNAQIMFLVLNTSGLTIIPVSVLALRAAEKAQNPSDVFIPILLATFFATIGGLLFVGIRQKINFLHPRLLMLIGGLSSFIILFIFWVSQLSAEQTQKLSSFGGSFILFSVMVLFFLLAARKKVDVYQSFIDGAKEGFQVSVKIIPYLVGMLVAIGVFRASGTLQFLTNLLGTGVRAVGLPDDFVEALPTAFMKPLSGSGARAMMVETMHTYGADSFQGFLASVFQGSTETTFYTLAVYFGAVNVMKTRYAATAGLFADLCGIVAAIFIAYLFFVPL